MPKTTTAVFTGKPTAQMQLHRTNIKRQFWLAHQKKKPLKQKLIHTRQQHDVVTIYEENSGGNSNAKHECEIIS